jgi:hypothetical protein
LAPIAWVHRLARNDLECCSEPTYFDFETVTGALYLLRAKRIFKQPEDKPSQHQATSNQHGDTSAWLELTIDTLCAAACAAAMVGLGLLQTCLTFEQGGFAQPKQPERC